VTVLGSTTCEDTAIVASRLRALGVPFLEVDIDADAAAARRVASLNGGRRVTPTVVVGDEAAVRAEPTLEALGALLVAAGHDVGPPQATGYHGELITRSIPVRHLEAVGRPLFSLEQLRGRRQVALFLGHDSGCLPCFGYARQLAGSRDALAEAEAQPLVVVADDIRAAGGWRHGIDDAVTILADPHGTWKQAVTAHVGARAGDAILLLLDRFGAPRAGSGAEEAGGLIDPAEAVEWLRFLALECPECSGELPWATV
jgi:glutaredoxin